MKLIVAFKKEADNDASWFWKWASDHIKYWTNSDYFHVELAIEKKWITAWPEQGIELHDLKPIYDPLFDYYEVHIPELTESQNKKFWKFLNDQVGSGYDWKGIFLTQFIKLDWESESKWFCSEIVAKLLQLLYIEEFMDKKPNRQSPQNIFEIISKIGAKIEIKQ